MDVETTPTEVQQTDAASPGLQTGDDVQSSEAEKSGAEKRIDELTRKFREQERQNQALAAQNSELMQTLTQTVSKMTQQVREPEPEIDPDEKKRMDFYLSPIQKQLAHVTAQLAASGAHQEVQAVVRAGTPPSVVQHAQALVSDWRKKGIPGTAQDAITYAMGEYVLKSGDEDAAVSAQRRDFNKGAAAVQTGQGNGAPRRGAQKQLSEDEIERLTPDAQAAYYGSRIGNEEF